MKVFVYGTLKRGYGNNRNLSSSTFISEGRTKDNYALYHCGFPKAVPEDWAKGDECLPVMGEIWEVGGDDLQRMDRLEGHPEWYVRHERTIILPNGEEEQAWIYEMPQQISSRLCRIDVDSTGCIIYRWD